MVEEGPEWRGVLAGIGYRLIFRRLDDVDAPRDIAEMLLQDEPADQAEHVRGAVRQALASDHDLGTTEHDDPAIRRFLRDLLAQLEQPLPWPAPDLRRTPLRGWEGENHPPLVGTVPMAVDELAARIGRPFHYIVIGKDERGLYELGLIFHTGQRLQLRSKPPDHTVRVEVRSADDPADVIAAFRRVTGIAVQPAPRRGRWWPVR